MKNIRFVLSENFLVLEVKLSIYLNRRVFVMLTFAILWANSITDEKLMIFFLFFPEKRGLTFICDNLHEMSKRVFLGKIRKNISIYVVC